MKGYATASAPPAKRRWKGFAVAVLALVFCSLVLPLTFLLGRFPSGYLTDEQPNTESSFGNYHGSDGSVQEQDQHEVDEAKINNLVKKFASTVPRAVAISNTTEADGHKEAISEAIGGGPLVTLKPEDTIAHSKPKDIDSHSKDLPATPVVSLKAPPLLDTRGDARFERDKHATGSTGDAIKRSCQLEFGSYCLWSIEHKEVLKDSMVKRLKDQLFLARGYYPSIAKLQGQEKLTLELKQHIQEHERMLGEAISDMDLPSFAGKYLQQMDQTIAKAKSCAVDCYNVDKKLGQLLDLTEDEAHFHMKQSAFLYQLVAQTMPKSLHCLSMRLTVEYFKSTPVDIEESYAHKLHSPSLRHYVIFSRNLLAVSVAINSTVMNSEETGNMVFHLVTDGQNFYAMKLWFARNSYKEATVHVMNIEDHGTDPLSPSEEFRVSIRNQRVPMEMRTEYLSVFGHTHFLLPEMFKELQKVVVLDDDVVVQRDLSMLWDLDLSGKVNGAVEFCGVRVGQLKAYLGGVGHGGDACAWMSGLNVVDLEKWREHNVTGIYQRLLGKLQDGNEEASWRAAALPVSLLAFQDLTYAMDDSWVLSGLGHKYGVEEDTMAKASVLLYNGNMKPWLDLGIPKYKHHWKKFLAQGEQFMDECNINQ